MLMTLLLLVVPLTALGLVLGMARLEENLLQPPAATPDSPAAVTAAVTAAPGTGAVL